MKKTAFGVLLVWLLFFVQPVRAAEISLPDLTAMQEAGDAWMDKDQMEISSLLSALLRGEDPLQAADPKQRAAHIVENFFTDMTGLFRQMLLMLLCAALFQVLAGLVEDRQIAQMGFSILFMLLATLLIRDFVTETKKLETLLNSLCNFMQASGTAYSLVVLGASGTASAAFFTQGILLVAMLTQKLIAGVFLPVMVCAVLLGICDKLSEERLISVLTEGMEKLVIWGFHTVMAAVTGVQLLRNMLAPAFDSFRRSAVGRAAASLPGIGSMVDAAAQTLLASAVLIRNCMGIAVLIVLFCGALTPVLHMTVRCGMFYLLAAIAQPVADQRIVGCLRVVARGYGIYVRLLAGTVVLFFLVVAVMTQTA